MGASKLRKAAKKLFFVAACGSFSRRSTALVDRVVSFKFSNYSFTFICNGFFVLSSQCLYTIQAWRLNDH